MSTGNNVTVRQPGLMPGLPAPKVTLINADSSITRYATQGGPSGNATAKVVTGHDVRVTVPGIPEEILDNIAKYQPQIELMRYRRKTANSGNAFRSSAKAGFVHPSHGPAPSGGGKYTHGGDHGGLGGAPATLALRLTEWPVTGPAIALDATQGVLGFMGIFDVRYRDNTGIENVVSALCPHGYSSANRMPGRRFPYARAFTPGYFEFRLSVIDPSDPRGKRIHGPSSTRVVCSNTYFPFIPAGLSALGKAQADIDPRHQPDRVNFWLGSPSRLPAS